MKKTMLRNFFKKFPSFHNTPETAKMLDHVTHDGLVTVFGKVVAQKTNDLPVLAIERQALPCGPSFYEGFRPIRGIHQVADRDVR